MANDDIYFYDHSTGEEIVREMTDQEQAERNAEITKATTMKAEAEAQAQALKEAKISAYQKLGLTEEEIEALLPTPKADELEQSL